MWNFGVVMDLNSRHRLRAAIARLLPHRSRLNHLAGCFLLSRDLFVNVYVVGSFNSVNCASIIYLVSFY